MAYIPWDSAFELVPPGTEDLNLGDNRIRELKENLRDRVEVEHNFSSFTAGYTDDGRHNPGSARAFADTVTPTAVKQFDGTNHGTMPGGVTLPALGLADKGRIWFDESTVPSTLRYWDGTTWASTTAAGSVALSSISNRLFNGSLLVSQRRPADVALWGLGALPVNVDTYTVDRWFLLPAGAAVTLTRTVTASDLHSQAASPHGVRIAGSVGNTSVRFGQRLGRGWARAMGALRANQNVTFGCKVKCVLDGGLSLTPRFVVRTTSNTGDDFTNTKFAAGSMSTAAGFPVNFPGALTTGQEVSFTHTFDLGAMTNGQNGIEVYVEWVNMTAGQWSITDLWLSHGNIGPDLLPDEFQPMLERCLPYYQKSFEYDVQPSDTLGNITPAISMTGNPAGTTQAFQWQHNPPMRGNNQIVTTFNPFSAGALASNVAGQDAAATAATGRASITTITFTTNAGVGQREDSWHLNATADGEWYD